MIVHAVPSDETSSALALNQVLRTVGYSIGSALSATILTAHTPASSPLPSNEGYTVGAAIAIGLCLLTAVLGIVLPYKGEIPNELAATAGAGRDVDAEAGLPEFR